MRVKRPPPLSPVRFRAELKSRVNAGELTFSVKMDQVTVCGLYDTIFVKAFEEYAYMTSTWLTRRLTSSTQIADGARSGAACGGARSVGRQGASIRHKTHLVQAR